MRSGREGWTGGPASLAGLAVDLDLTSEPRDRGRSGAGESWEPGGASGRLAGEAPHSDARVPSGPAVRWWLWEEGIRFLKVKVDQSPSSHRANPRPRGLPLWFSHAFKEQTAPLTQAPRRPRGNCPTRSVRQS